MSQSPTSLDKMSQSPTWPVSGGISLTGSAPADKAEIDNLRKEVHDMALKWSPETRHGEMDLFVDVGVDLRDIERQYYACIAEVWKEGEGKKMRTWSFKKSWRSATERGALEGLRNNLIEREDAEKLEEERARLSKKAFKKSHKKIAPKKHAVTTVAFSESHPSSLNRRPELVAYMAEAYRTGPVKVPVQESAGGAVAESSRMAMEREVKMLDPPGFPDNKKGHMK